MTWSSRRRNDKPAPTRRGGSTLRRVQLAVLLTAGFATQLARAADLDIVQAAVKAEELAPRKQAELIYHVGAREIRYRIERVLPDRIRILVESAGQSKEMIGIGTVMYVREQGGWRKVLGAPPPVPPISVADFFRERLKNVVEVESIRDQNGVVRQQVFSGDIRWASGIASLIRNEGTLRIFIERSSGLLQKIKFEGRCGAEQCEFEHAITYDPSVDVVDPK